MRAQTLAGIVLLAALPASVGVADILDVPDDFPTIQAAIDAAVDGDRIIVAPGTYNETINFLGKAITLRSSDGPEITIIHAQAAGIVVTCDSGEEPGTVLAGFTITGGHQDPGDGGGMRNIHSSPTVRNCVFKDNVAGSGGGMYNEDAAPTVINCIFDSNYSSYPAGGGYVQQ